MPQLLQFGLMLLVYRAVQPLDCYCNHTALPPAISPNHEEVELLLNCSLNYLSITTIFKIPQEELIIYTILYTCVHMDYRQPMQHVAICDAIRNKTKPLNERIPCGSFCTFGGCYKSGPLGAVVDYRIPQQSCFVCNDEGGTCPTNRTCGGQCTPSLNLGSDTVHCNCSAEEDCSSTTSNTSTPGTVPLDVTTVGSGMVLPDSTTAVGSRTVPLDITTVGSGMVLPDSTMAMESHTVPLDVTTVHVGSGMVLPDSTMSLGSRTMPPDSTMAVDESSLSKCAVLSQGYGCECFSSSPNSSLLFCSNVSGCDNICDACTYTEYIRHCSSIDRNVPIIVMAVPILIVSILFVSLCLTIILCSILSKNRRKETRPVFVESKVFDEISAFDPVDVAVPPPYPFDDALSGSFSTLLHSFESLSPVNQLRTASALSNHSDSCMDSECHLSDAEGYIVCRDCPGTSCDEIKMCHHCQMKDDKS